MWALSGTFLGAFVSVCMRYMREGIHFAIGPFWFSAGLCLWSPLVHSIMLNSSYDNDQAGEKVRISSTKYDLDTCLLIILVSLLTIVG